LDLSFSKAKTPIPNARGGARVARIPPRSLTISEKVPPRDPLSGPHPKPGKHNKEGTIKNHGTNANQKLVFPSVVAFFM